MGMFINVHSQEYLLYFSLIKEDNKEKNNR